MLNAILERITGKDDLERVASRENLGLLNGYLETRRVLIARRPTRFLEPDVPPAEILKTLEEECRELANDPFEPWVLELDGKRRLPVFSSRKKLDPFVTALAERLHKIFGIQTAEVLLPEVGPQLDIDFADLNPYSPRCWEIGMRGH